MRKHDADIYSQYWRTRIATVQKPFQSVLSSISTHGRRIGISIELLNKTAANFSDNPVVGRTLQRRISSKQKL